MIAKHLARTICESKIKEKKVEICQLSRRRWIVPRKWLLTVLVAPLLMGCVDPAVNKALQRCERETQRAMTTRFNTGKSEYSQEVVAEYWQKKRWDELPVSVRKDLVANTEDTAARHHVAVRKSAFFGCMAESGYFVNRRYPYRPYRWYVDHSITSKDRLSIPDPADCLIDRECDPGYECQNRACVSAQDTNAEDGCRKDADCKGDRICELGQCRNP